VRKRLFHLRIAPLFITLATRINVKFFELFMLMHTRLKIIMFLRQFYCKVERRADLDL